MFNFDSFPLSRHDKVEILQYEDHSWWVIEMKMEDAYLPRIMENIFNEGIRQDLVGREEVVIPVIFNGGGVE